MDSSWELEVFLVVLQCMGRMGNGKSLMIRNSKKLRHRSLRKILKMHLFYFSMKNSQLSFIKIKITQKLFLF